MPWNSGYALLYSSWWCSSHLVSLHSHLALQIFGTQSPPMNLRSSLFMFVSLALTYVPSTQAKTTVFDSGMIQPFSLVFGEDGTAYGVEYEKGNRVFSIKPDGEVQFIAGRNTPGGKKLGDVAEGDGGNMTGARFNGMHELALHPDGKRVFIADTFNHRVRLLDLEVGSVSTFAGTGGKAGFGGDGGPASKSEIRPTLHRHARFCR